MYRISRKIINLVLIICFTAFIGACALPSVSLVSTPAALASSTPPEWILHWLANPVCSPPCWETITPGISSVDTISSIQTLYPKMYVETQKGESTVLMITLDLVYENVPLRLIVEKYGQPNYVRLYKCDPGANCETHVIFEKLGMVLNFYLPPIDNQPIWTVEISPESNIFRIYFIEVGLDKYWYNFSGDPKKMDEWKGYGAYSNQ